MSTEYSPYTKPANQPVEAYLPSPPSIWVYGLGSWGYRALGGSGVAEVGCIRGLLEKAFVSKRTK